MKIKKVTFTGASDEVQPEQLIELSKAHSFIEWAILFSQTKQGIGRFPTENWLHKLQDSGLIVAAHLCGGWPRDFINGKYTFDDHFFKNYNRIQLNITDDMFMILDFQKLVDVFPRKSPIILQTKRKFDRCEWVALINQGETKLDVLYDVSGGKGIKPKKWAPPVDGVFCGYAGGINPDNILSVLDGIQEVAGDREIWIDMESGVRTNDKFDLDKVKLVCEQVSNWILK